MSKILNKLRRPGADTTRNVLSRDVIGSKADVAATVFGSSTSVMSYLKRLCGAEITIAKTDGAVLEAKDPLFIITGGPIMVMEFVGVVTTILAGTANLTINCSVAVPAADVALSTTVAVNDDAAGTTYTFSVAAPGVLTPTTAGLVVAVPAMKWLVPIGTINALGSAAATGVIAWYMSYKPLSPLSQVVVAA